MCRLRGLWHYKEDKGKQVVGMKEIHPDVIEKTFKEMGEMTPEKAHEIIERMDKEQPLILGYLMEVDGDALNMDEREVLLYLGVVVWQIISRKGKGEDTPLPEITEDILDNAVKSNEKMIESLENESSDDFIASVRKMVKNNSHPELLKVVVEALMEEPEDGCVMRDENKGMMMVYLKTVIDCFSR